MPSAHFPDVPAAAIPAAAVPVAAVPVVSAEAFLACARASIDLASRPEVSAQWDQESACAGMTVGGLAHHLVAQVRRAAELLALPVPAEAPVIGLLDHYERAPWVADSRQGEVDPDQTHSDNSAALAGPGHVLARAEESLAALPSLLEPSARPAAVHIPWQGWTLPVDAFLTTRLMEMVVHGDDLAASVGLETPELPEAVSGPVLNLLVLVAARRHGQVALVRALSRPQRASGDVSAF